MVLSNANDVLAYLLQNHWEVARMLHEANLMCHLQKNTQYCHSNDAAQYQSLHSAMACC